MFRLLIFLMDLGHCFASRKCGLFCLAVCLLPPSLPWNLSWTSRSSEAVVRDKYGFGGGSWLILKCRNPETSNILLLLYSTHSCTSSRLGLQKKADWGVVVFPICLWLCVILGVGVHEQQECGCTKAMFLSIFRLCGSWYF